MRLLVIGIDASVADPRSPSAERQRAYYAGWDVEIVLLTTGESRTVELASNLRVHVSGGKNRVQALFNGIRCARRLINAKPFDVVTAQDPVWSGLVSFYCKRRFTGFHLQDHSGFFSRPAAGMLERFLRPFSRRLARRATRVRTVSERGKRGLMGIGVSEDRIDVVPVASDLTRFFSLERNPNTVPEIVCVSRLSPEKGLEVLLDAFIGVQQRIPTARLTIVGDGPLLPLLRQRAESIGIAEAVTFAGHHADVAPFLSRASVYIQPSRFEGWGIAVLEAAAAGCPIVMTDVGLAGEVVKNGESASIVPPGDTQALTEALVHLLDQPVEAERLGAAAREAAKRRPSTDELRQRVRHSLEAARITPRLLVLAQAVDLDDPLFGFFHGWLTKAAERFPRLIVGALRVGRHALPSPVEVLPLRPAASRSRLAVAWNLWRISWSRRAEYDAVFIRGDAQYLALAGWLWKLIGKPSVFWYTHTSAKSFWFWAAAPWATRVVTAVPESNPLKRAIPIGHHLDLEAFPFVERKMEGRPTVLVFGRMSPVKRVDLIVRALAPLADEGRITLLLAGKATDAEYRERIRSILPSAATWADRDVPPTEAPTLYANADVIVNATEASLDKVILEAASSGCVVFASSRGILRGLPEELSWLRFEDGDDLRASVVRFATLPSDERLRIGRALRAWVEENHSMRRHLDRLAELVGSL